MKVSLIAGIHPIYEDLIKFPPKNIEYITNIKKETFDKLEIYFNRGYKRKKDISTKLMNFLSLPRINYTFSECDLIHSSRGFLMLNRKPWVIDIEHVASFVCMQHEKLLKIKPKILKFLESKYCKKILPHCIAAEKSFHSIFGKSLDEKLEVVYPAIRTYNFKHKRGEKLKLLFIGRNFYEKGGNEVLKAYEILKKKYDVELVVKSNVPEDIKRKFSDVKFSEEIVNREDLFKKYYFTSDIFVFPSYMDTFGYVLLEAMVGSLPIIATDIFAIPEIVENNKNGFLIKSPLSWADRKCLFKWKSWGDFVSLTKLNHSSIVKQLVEKISILIEDTSLRKQMGRYGRRLVEKGKFSIKERNKKLRRIYEEALRY